MFNPELRKAKKELGSDTRYKMNLESQGVERDGKPWMFYDSSGEDYFGFEKGTFSYFDTLGNLKAEVDAWHSDGQKVASLDIMGQGEVGADLGCDVSLGLTLPNENLHEQNESYVEDKLDRGIGLIKGDIFDKKTLLALEEGLQKIANSGVGLKYVFFRPLGGVVGIGDNEYAKSVLSERLLPMIIQYIDMGGKIFLDLAGFQDADEFFMRTRIKYQGVLQIDEDISQRRIFKITKVKDQRDVISN